MSAPLPRSIGFAERVAILKLAFAERDPEPASMLLLPDLRRTPFTASAGRFHANENAQSRRCLRGVPGNGRHGVLSGNLRGCEQLSAGDRRHRDASLSDIVMAELLGGTLKGQPRVSVNWPAQAAPYTGSNDLTLGASINVASPTSTPRSTRRWAGSAPTPTVDRSTGRR